jgi:hypothetical protein
MSKKAAARDTELLERFVATFGAWDDLMALDSVPAELAAPPRLDDDDSFTYWRPVSLATSMAAAEELERFLPRRLPPLFRQLVLSYRYLEVDLDRYQLLANPPSTGLDGLREEMFRDKALSDVLLRLGYIQFGRGRRSNYDPLCFDIARRHSSGDMEVVRLDHEEILCYSRIRVVERVAPDFRELVEETISQYDRRARQAAPTTQA